jgi:hypothetical protein
LKNGTLENIVNTFPVTEEEYENLNKMFGNLAHYAVWQLHRKNSKNNHTNEPDDDVQELRIALLRAGSYYKRQTYIEGCFDVLNKFVKDKFIKRIIKQLKQLWINRRRHGANKQVFGVFQERILEKLVVKYVSMDYRPNREQPLKIDGKFSTYLKQIVWNAQKNLGKRITREKSFRSGMVSLSEYDYLGAN